MNHTGLLLVVRAQDAQTQPQTVNQHKFACFLYTVWSSRVLLCGIKTYVVACNV